nr:DNA-dependent protein kinase catalytic subunit-like [Lytechinus pictus]
MSVDPGPYKSKESGSTPRYDIPKAGLNLIGRHAAQLNEYLYRDHEMVYSRLLYWSHSRNSEMKWAGYEALQSFLKVVSYMLVENAEKKRSSDIAVLKLLTIHWSSRYQHENP